VTPWWDQINFSPTAIELLVEGTGWWLVENLGDAEAYGIALRRR